MHAGGAATTPTLPQPLTSFVGREREVAAVGDLLARDDVRLLTLTGPGGIGKTRLALEVLQRASVRVEHIWFVPLATVRDAGLVATTVLRALGLDRAGESRSLADAVGALVGERPALLVLDNLEQVVESGPELVELVLRCPSLTVLITSRVPLRVYPERLRPVPALGLPDGRSPVMPDGSEAVRLFVDRAAAVDPAFALTPMIAPTVAEICRRLDGLPLAIELAAARMALFSPSELLERMDASLLLLRRPMRDQPPRLRSMRDSIAWSHDLLEDEEQVLFAQLAVFSGGWTLGAAEAVAVPAGDRPVMELLGSLVAMNLVRAVSQADGSMRYGMLETIREFAEECLARDPEESRLRDRHAAFFEALAATCNWCWFRPLPDGEPLLNRLQLEHANLRAALGWHLRKGHPGAALRLAAQLNGLWVVCGQLDEGRRWLEATLDAEVPGRLRLRGMAMLSWISNQQDGRGQEASDLAERALAMLPPDEASLDMVACRVFAGVGALKVHDPRRAVTRLRAAIETLEALDSPDWRHNWIATLHDQLTVVALLDGDVDEAEHHMRLSAEVVTERGHQVGRSHVYGGHVLGTSGDIARARADPARAFHLYREALELAWRFRNTRVVLYTLGGIAACLAVLGEHEDAARLFGASEAQHEIHGYGFAWETLDRQRALGLPEPWLRVGESFGAWQALRDVLNHPPLPRITDPEAAAVAWARGRQLSLEDAVVTATAATIPGDVPVLFGLTPREMEVLRLLAEGRPDADIAAGLRISRRTVTNHLAGIYGKLGVSNRAQAAAMAVRSGLA